jgi:hypothetical protein
LTLLRNLNLNGGDDGRRRRRERILRVSVEGVDGILRQSRDKLEVTVEFCGLEWMKELKGDGPGVVEVVFVVVGGVGLEIG